MKVGFEDRRPAWNKAAVIVATSLMLLSGAALAGREDTIEFNRDLLSERVDEGVVRMSYGSGRLAPERLAD